MWVKVHLSSFEHAHFSLEALVRARGGTECIWSVRLHACADICWDVQQLFRSSIIYPSRLPLNHNFIHSWKLLLCLLASREWFYISSVSQWHRRLSLSITFKVTADGDCSHEIKRHLLLGREAMTNLDNILKDRDITLPTKFCIVKLWFSQ